MTVLQIEQAVKRRGDRVTLSGVDLQVGAGERVALLGHNGAGKTTLMHMVLGLTPVDGGCIRVAGHEPGSAEARRCTAYLPENVAFHRSLTGREQIRHFARLRGEPVAQADTLLERVGLAADANRAIRTYSKGMCQRLGLAQALLGRPRLALLDEPASGLDPAARRELYHLVDDLAVSGGAVLLSSHALTEMEASTDRIVILRKGQVVANDTLTALRRMAELPIRLRVVGKPDKADQLFSRIGGKRVNGCMVEVSCPHQDKMAFLAAVHSFKDLVDDLEIVSPGLDDLYHYYNNRGEGSA